MANLVLYNTVMGLAASAGLLLLVVFTQRGARAPTNVRQAWAVVFGTLGGVLTVLAVHVNVEWPLLGAANIIFGEPSLMFGVLLLAAAAIIYRTPVEETRDLSELEGGASVSDLWNVEPLPQELAVALRPVAYVGALSGVMVVLLGWGGAAFGEIVFRPPASEWPTGLVAGTGLEIVYMVVTYTLLGAGAMVLPAGLRDPGRLRVAGVLLSVSALLVLFITLISFVGHISLSAGVPPGGIPWPPN
jgi:uncharacterized membrane protein